MMFNSSLLLGSKFTGLTEKHQTVLLSIGKRDGKIVTLLYGISLI